MFEQLLQWEEGGQKRLGQTGVEVAHGLARAKETIRSGRGERRWAGEGEAPGRGAGRGSECEDAQGQLCLGLPQV